MCQTNLTVPPANATNVNHYFPNLPMSHYSVFISMINMVDYTSLEVENKTIIYILHLTFVVVIAILLLNLIIAVFSTLVAEISSNRHVIFNLTKHSVLRLSMDRMMKIMPHLVRWLQKRYCQCSGNKIYIKTVTIYSSKNLTHQCVLPCSSDDGAMVSSPVKK